MPKKNSHLRIQLEEKEFAFAHSFEKEFEFANSL